MVLALAASPAAAVAHTGPGTGHTAGVLADEDGGPLDDILADENESAKDDGWFGSLDDYAPDYFVESMAAFDGQLQRFYAGIVNANPFGEEPPTNREHAAAFVASIHEHNETYRQFLNNETTPSTAYDVHKVTFAHEGSPPASVYVIGIIRNDSLAGIEAYPAVAVDESHIDPDVRWVATGLAARDLDALTGTLAGEIAEGSPIDETRQAQLAGRYCDSQAVLEDGPPGTNCDIRSSLWMDNSTLYEGINMEASE